MNVITALQDFYFQSKDMTDRRVADWLFVATPFPTLSIVALYLLVVCFIGPKYMEKRYDMLLW